MLEQKIETEVMRAVKALSEEELEVRAYVYSRALNKFCTFGLAVASPCGTMFGIAVAIPCGTMFGLAVASPCDTMFGLAVDRIMITVFTGDNRCGSTTR